MIGMKTRWPYALIAMLVVLNLLLLYQNVTLKTRSETHSARLTPVGEYVNQAILPDLPVQDEEGISHTLRRLVETEPFTLLVFFSPSDCPTCFAEAELWQEVREKRDVAVYGIGTSPNGKEFWQWVKHSGITIDVYLDTTFSVDGMMQFTTTPLKVLSNSEGVILWADPPRERGEDENQFWGDLDHALATH